MLLRLQRCETERNAIRSVARRVEHRAVTALPPLRKARLLQRLHGRMHRGVTPDRLFLRLLVARYWLEVEPAPSSLSHRVHDATPAG